MRNARVKIRKVRPQGPYGSSYYILVDRETDEREGERSFDTLGQARRYVARNYGEEVEATPTSPPTPASPSSSEDVYGPAPDLRGLDPISAQKAQEQAFVAWAQSRAQLPKGLTYWLECAAINQLRMGAYHLPRHPDYPATREEAQRWAAREARGLPANPGA